MSVLDEVGYWTEIKLAILKKYSAAYTSIMKSHPVIREYAYIDGFAGAGKHISRETGEIIEGSPSIALNLPHKFTHYHFIDLDGKRIVDLKKLSEGRANVRVWPGDCNDILLNKIFPHYPYKSFRRALCLLDPYNLNPNWAVVQRAGELGTIEIFLNFMIYDANLNILFGDPEEATAAQKKRFSDFWGDTSWERIAYLEEEPDLFGLKRLKKVTTETIMTAYRERLKSVAGFKYVPEPVPMRNAKGVPLYYLFFASQNEAGSRIAAGIFKKYREYRAH
jgi:three-Cys-motif partner protein